MENKQSKPRFETRYSSLYHAYAVYDNQATGESQIIHGTDHPHKSVVECITNNLNQGIGLVQYGLEPAAPEYAYTPDPDDPKDALIARVLFEMQKSMELGDYEASAELLNFLPIDNLKNFLPEDEQGLFCTE